MTHIIFDMDGLLLNTMVSNRRVSEYISSDICSGFLGGGEGGVHTNFSWIALCLEANRNSNIFSFYFS